MDSAIYLNGKQCTKLDFDKEDAFENIIFDNSKLLFGQNAVLISKRLIKTVSLGNTIPDGFLFDFNDKNNPQFYLIEIELAKHSFYEHIFPQITKFIAFFKSPESRKMLIDKLFDSISQNSDLQKEFKELLESKEIFKTITDGVENSQNILLILNEAKPEIEETKKAYSEWDRLVKLEVASFYKSGKESIITLSPPFEEVDLDIDDSETVGSYTENTHLEFATEEIRSVYDTIKSKMLQFDKYLTFNPQRYYISMIHNRNFTFFQLRKTKLNIIITLPFSVGKKMIKKHKLTQLSEGVQTFYNARCFRVTVEDNKNIGEIIQVLKENYKNTVE